MNRSMEKKIAQWLRYQPRTRLVFIRSRQLPISFVNFGYEFAKLIEPILHTPKLPMKALQFARDIVKANIKLKENFGAYVALENWVILLEPELKIDIKNFLTSISQNTTVILRIDDAIENNKIHNIDLSNFEYYHPDK